MNSVTDRIGWIETDLRNVAAKAEEIERRTRAIEWSDEMRGSAERRREFDDAREEVSQLKRRCWIIEQTIAEHRADTIDGVRILRSRADVQTLALCVLALVSLAEAVAIGLLWWFR